MANRGALVDYASGILGNRVRAEDMVQEAWMRLDQAAQSRFLDQPLSYLYRIVRNLALDDRRRSVREHKVVAIESLETATDRLPDERPSPEETVLYKAEFGLLMDALAELPERTRIALEMHRFGECKLREIAEVLGVSLPMAHTLVSQGIQHCKRRLGWP
jgi:RNA polymerase sigma-70 factor (ECF subfamily)